MKIFCRILMSLFMVLAVLKAIGQSPDKQESRRLDKVKREGKPDYSKLRVRKQILQKTAVRQYPITSSINTAQALCHCEIPLDASFLPVPMVGDGGSCGACGGGAGIPPNYRNNDGWTDPAIPLPFNFQFYGQIYTIVYINNNGNVTFNIPCCGYDANGFPEANHKMIAPFWGDVDTRADTGGITRSGVVYYKLTSTALIVKWDSVGYFNTYGDDDGCHDEKLNSFQLVITNGTDPLLPPGYNVSFCYGDMQWTTGDSSNGTNGFGGRPATVGINAGDGINFAQIGTFGVPGNSYIGISGNSGIDFLDQQAFFFNTSIATGSSNIPPIVHGLTTCDTVVICTQDTIYSDTIPLNFSFLSPELGQITTVTATGPPSLTVLSNTPGNIVNLTAQIVIYSQSPGLNTITLVAVDDGTPPASDTINISFKVDDFALHPPSITGSHFYCAGASPGGVNLHVNPIYQAYQWSNGTTGIDSLHVLSGTYNCEVTNDHGCKAKTPAFPVLAVTPQPIIGGITAFCGTDSAHLHTTQTFDHYQWLHGGIPAGDTSATLNLGQTDIGIYSVIVTVDSIACMGTSPSVNVDEHSFPHAQFSLSPVLAFGGDTIHFHDLSIPGSGTIAGWLWDFGDGATSTLQNPDHAYDSAGTYTVSLTSTQSDGCIDKFTFAFTVESDEIIPPNIFTPNGDQVNDVFKIKNLEFFPNSKLEVFSRWGRKVYENSNYDNKWNGGDALEGVYYYILKIPEKDVVKGIVTIKR